MMASANAGRTGPNVIRPRLAVQRYEAGEHAKLGETQGDLQAAFAAPNYVVVKGDSIKKIAAKFKVTAAELKATNAKKVKKSGSGKRRVEIFEIGETISIPLPINDFARTATQQPSATFTVNGVVLDYGVGIAMADLFESPEQMASAPEAELRELARLIKSEQATGKLVSTKDWETATKKRYLDLASKNSSHFAPPNPGVVTPTAAGAGGPNHRTEWEKHHVAAIDASRGGDKDKALMLNSFADHFLTDAFAAGHLVNKADTIAAFNSQLKTDPKTKEFLPDSQSFFDGIAKDSFTGAVQAEFSKYEMHDAYALGWKPNIDSISRFSTLLQRIHQERPDILSNAVAKSVHDRLNTFPGGVPVENRKGNAWKLSGDTTLNSDTTTIARKAVAQSQTNVISAFNLMGPVDATALFQRVWDFTPIPSAAGLKLMADETRNRTDIKGADLRKSVVDLIRANYLEIIDKLVSMKKLKLA